ncbi:MAG TPA: hypothetical protein VH413_00600 [Verrucomicrobiae bacterium]|jgi:hypothetical protein|nr:hypothetical protein [Verrucomicrobiae bacterium]
MIIFSIRRAAIFVLLASAVAWFTGCAFDVVHLKQTPVDSFTPASGASFELVKEVRASLGTTYLTVLKAGTTWRESGSIRLGKVFHTQDQIVKVEGSNIYEADLVVADGSLVGFYLPVEQSFVRLSTAIPLETKNNH